MMSRNGQLQYVCALIECIVLPTNAFVHIVKQTIMHTNIIDMQKSNVPLFILPECSYLSTKWISIRESGVGARECNGLCTGFGSFKLSCSPSGVDICTALAASIPSDLALCAFLTPVCHSCRVIV